MHHSRFSTSRQTLTWIPDTFFTSLLSGRISTLVDDQGHIFIDRDPSLFTVVLNYLRTKDLQLPETKNGIRALLHEAEFYGINPLMHQLKLVQELEQSSCGNVLYYGSLNPPSRLNHKAVVHNKLIFILLGIPLPEARPHKESEHDVVSTHPSSIRVSSGESRPSLTITRGTNSSRLGSQGTNRLHSRSSSFDMRWNSLRPGMCSQQQLAAWFGGLHGMRTSLYCLKLCIITLCFFSEVCC